MKESMFKLLYQYVDQLVKAVSTIGYYDHVVEDIERQKKEFEPIHKKYEDQIQDQDTFGNLSPQEQQAVGQNEINYRQMIQQMNEVMTELIRRKWTRNTQLTLWQLENIQLELKAVLGDLYNLEENGQSPTAKQIIPDKLEKADYLDKIPIIQIAIDVLCDDILEDAQLGVDISDFYGKDDTRTNSWMDEKLIKYSLISKLRKASVLLQNEMEEVEANGLPNTEEFEKPKIVEPEIPDSPVDQEQKEEVEPVNSD